MNHFKQGQTMLTQEAVDSYRKNPVPAQQLLINGTFAAADNGETITVTSPIDGSVLTQLAAAGSVDVDNAVRAARRAFTTGHWSSMAPAQRKQVLKRWAELIRENAMELAVLGVRDNGTEINMAYKAEPLSAAATLDYYAEAADKVYGEVAPSNSDALALIQREAVGVIGAIVPWNFPLMIGSWKIAPALAMGNSVVLKPAETASLSLLRMAELGHEAGLPEGVLNVVTGYGNVAGEALALHPDVDVIAFTGSSLVGRRLLEYSARSNLKRVLLELGGKSPNIVFADVADLDAAVTASVNGVFRNSGQVCIAATRLILQDDIADEFVAKLIDKTAALRVGDPLSLTTDIGAIASEAQLRKNCQFVEQASAEGAKLVTGGHPLLQETGGYYMQPTVFTEVTPTMQIAREEVFGPLLSILRFTDADDAIRIANASDYGLSAGLWTSNLSVAHRLTRRIQAGTVHVNCYGGSDLTVPLGGVKQSGNSHDKSLHALDHYSHLKTAWIKL